MQDQLAKHLNIRYIKLHFTVMMLEDSVLPKYKSSAIRGGMGQMLLKANCIKDTKCQLCDFVSECNVQRTMYTKMDKAPDFMRDNDSVGYVIECENYHEYFEEGDSWSFNLILFGKTLCYFNLYLQALYMLGQAGIGRNHAPFQITSITNSTSEDILDQYGNILMERYTIKRLYDYVEYRLKYIDRHGLDYKIKFQSPLSLKQQGKALDHFQMEAILLACARRIYMLDCLENLDLEKYRIDLSNVPVIVNQTVRLISIPRYSTRHNSKMYLKGIEGRIDIDKLSEEQLILLLAGELIHIGKHTSFGFGRLRIL